ncbi:hypothetical protein [Streptomyces sp. NBC_01235]|nr:hypothetical protein OG289_02895 [Streptomyces sp. NBC_01235]
MLEQEGLAALMGILAFGQARSPSSLDPTRAPPPLQRISAWFW